MAKTASLKATNRPGGRCAEWEPSAALPVGACDGASERTRWITEATHALLGGDGITGTSSHEGKEASDVLCTRRLQAWGLALGNWTPGWLRAGRGDGERSW